MTGDVPDKSAGGLPLSAALDVIDPPPQPANEKQTAKRAIELLVSLESGFREPTRRQRDALLVGFALKRQVLYGAAFDVVRLNTPIDLDNPQEIAANLDAITVYEVKSTSKAATKPDFSGYFFDLTTAELLVAQSLGDRFRFAFVNTMTQSWIELSLADVFGRARKIYPKWAILF